MAERKRAGGGEEGANDDEYRNPWGSEDALGNIVAQGLKRFEEQKRKAEREKEAAKLQQHSVSASTEEGDEYKNPWGDEDSLGSIVDRGLKDFEARKQKAEAAKRQKAEKEAGVPKEKEREKDKQREHTTSQMRSRGQSARDRSRSRSRERRSTRRRSRSRSKSRSRSRSPRHRYHRSHRRRSRSRSRSRERERGRHESRVGRDRHDSKNYSPRRNHRHRHDEDRRDRHRHHHRQRHDRNRSRDRSRSRSRDRYERSRDRQKHRRRSPSPSSSSSSEDEQQHPGASGLFNFTAAQVVERFLEVWSTNKTSSRVQELLELFDLHQFKAHGLIKWEELLAASELKKSFGMTLPWKSEPSKRLYFECANPKDPTFALDFYKAGKGPCFSHKGYELYPPTNDLVLLYRVKDNKLTDVYAAEDKEGLVVTEDVTEEDVLASVVGKQALDIMLRPGGFTNPTITKVFHNYENIEVLG